jgi:formiminoglutamase
MLTNHCYEPPSQSIWQGRTDTLPNERIFQFVDCINIHNDSLSHTPPSKALLGFCSDEGVRRNQGRPGAQFGPDALRRQLATLAYHGSTRLLDIGNVACSNNQLETAQYAFSELVSNCHSHDLTTIALGGGHEIAWAHFQGLAPHYRKLGIINFDAHFDIRIPQSNQQSTSGTPFAQIKQYCDDNHREFHYCCLGIQPSANTKSLFERAYSWGIHYLTAEQMHQEPLSMQLAFLNQFLSQHDAIYLTICMDVFAESYAPGVSAPQSLGINPTLIIPLLKIVAQSGKVVGLDIAELSPPLDEHDKTARLAARLLAELL